MNPMNRDSDNFNGRLSASTAGPGYERAQTATSVPAVHGAQETLSSPYVLEALESRLGPILAPLPTAGNKIDGAEPPPPHNLASRINRSAGEVGNAARRLSYLLERLEI